MDDFYHLKGALKVGNGSRIWRVGMSSSQDSQMVQEEVLKAPALIFLLHVSKAETLHEDS